MTTGVEGAPDGWPYRRRRHAPASGRLVAGLLGLVLALAGCAGHLDVIPEKNQGPEQLAQDQRECEAETRNASSYARMVGKAFVGSLVGPIVGLVVGGAAGLAVAVASLKDTPTNRPLQDLGISVGVGAGVGAVVGAIVGPKAGVKEEQHAMAESFRRCMRDRGYTVGRDEPAH
jgi:uncharacterized protein YcfJ